MWHHCPVLPSPEHSHPQPWPTVAAPEELLRDLGTSSEQCPGRGLPLAPQKVPGLPSRFGLSCCTALGHECRTGKGGDPQRSPWCCGRSCLGAGCAGGRREAHVGVGMARGEGRTPPITAPPQHFHVALSLLCCWTGRTSRKSDLHSQDVRSYNLCPWKL